MVKVLIADNDLDSHELIDDLIEMTFRDVQIERALSKESLFLHLGTNYDGYDLIVFNYTLGKDEVDEVLLYLTTYRPELLEHIIFITNDKYRLNIPPDFSVLVRPFSLDEFNSMVKKICVTR